VHRFADELREPAKSLQVAHGVASIHACKHAYTSG
jgi:hypothetical protein